jgi:hypothetical protein
MFFKDLGEEVFYVPLPALGCSQDIQGQFPGGRLGGFGFRANSVLRLGWIFL